MAEPGQQIAARAWLLELADGQAAAVGERELCEVLVAPGAWPVPHAPAYCREVVVWRDRPLPLLDLSVLFGARPGSHAAPWVAVAAYRDEDTGEIGYGGLALRSAPRTVDVDDGQAAALPRTSFAAHLVWRSIAVSCFSVEERVAPVLDTPRLFSGSGRQQLQRVCEAWV